MDKFAFGIGQIGIGLVKASVWRTEDNKKKQSQTAGKIMEFAAAAHKFSLLARGLDVNYWQFTTQINFAPCAVWPVFPPCPETP